jgi:hypothetical protein
MPNNNSFELPPVYLQSGDPESENVATLHASGTLGARFTVKQPTRSAAGVEAGRSKRYQLIRSDSTMTTNPYVGAVAWWADKARYLVTTSATNRNRIAGVFQNAITPGNYGCIQIGGPATVKVLDGDVAALAIGDAIIPSTTDGKATRVAVGTAPTHTVLGWVAGPAISVDVLNATVVVDLDVPETT